MSIGESTPDENKQLKVWSSEVERRDVYLTAKKMPPSWKKVTVRKTVYVENDKVIQIKYIGDNDWGSLKEKIENGPLIVRTYMIYLNVESDMTLSWTISLTRLLEALAGTEWSMGTSA